MFKAKHYSVNPTCSQTTTNIVRPSGRDDVLILTTDADMDSVVPCVKHYLPTVAYRPVYRRSHTVSRRAPTPARPHASDWVSGRRSDATDDRTNPFPFVPVSFCSDGFGTRFSPASASIESNWPNVRVPVRIGTVAGGSAVPVRTFELSKIGRVVFVSCAAHRNSVGRSCRRRASRRPARQCHLRRRPISCHRYCYCYCCCCSENVESLTMFRRHFVIYMNRLCSVT